MPEPLTSTGATTALVGVAFLSYVAGLDAEVVLGAFAGALFFVTNSAEYNIKTRVILAFASFLAGLVMYRPAAALILDVLPDNYSRGADATGALLAAACVVKILMAINRRIPALPNKGGHDHD